MSKASGLFLVVAGTATLCTGLLMQLPRDVDRRRAAQGIADGSDLRAWAGHEWWRAETPYVAPRPEPKQPEIATVVVAVPRRKETTAKAVAMPAKPGDRVALARELQRELRRVGCYDGAINGDWTLETRKAMKAFMIRVNAMMSVEQPDLILLALVKGHTDAACGAACPAGQAMANDGRCLPNAILAHAAKGAAPRTIAAKAISWSSTTSTEPHRLGDVAADPLHPGQEQAAPAAVASTVPVQRPTTRRAAEPRPEARQRSTFGPDFLRRADAVGHY